jgi:hypothetical protein
MAGMGEIHAEFLWGKFLKSPALKFKFLPLLSHFITESVVCLLASIKMAVRDCKDWRCVELGQDCVLHEVVVIK